MAKFYPGNVIRTKYGSIEIVCDVRKDTTSTVHINSYNTSACHPNETYEREEYCDCGECEYCYADKKFVHIYYGMDQAVLVAPTVKEWILRSLTKNFEF